MPEARIAVQILALLMMGGHCHARYDYQVIYLPHAGPTVGTKIILESNENATNGFDGEWKLVLPSPGNPLHIATYKSPAVDGWNGPEGFYSQDLRTPLAPGQTAVFNDVHLWAEPGTPSHDIQLELMSWVDRTAVTGRLFLLSIPNGVTYSGVREWGLDDQYVTLPFYSTDDGRTGYRFRAEFSAVPEPSSLLTLGLGGLGILGVVQRRRVGNRNVTFRFGNR